MTDHPQADCALKDKSQISWSERAIRKRFGIFMLVGLVSWPLLEFWLAAEAIVANALLLDTCYQLSILTMVNVGRFTSVLQYFVSRTSGSVANFGAKSPTMESRLETKRCTYARPYFP